MSKKDKENQIDYKNAIVLPIVVTLISSLFLIPIASSILDILKTASGSILGAFVDSYYINLAGMTPGMAILGLSQFFISIFIGMTLATLATAIEALWSIKKNKGSSQLSEKSVQASDLELQLQTSNNTQELERLQIHLRKLRIQMHVLKILMSCSIILVFIVMIFYYIIPSTKYADFKQKIDIISPYVSSETIIQLNSDWARMKCKSDYLVITDTIERICDANNLN